MRPKLIAVVLALFVAVLLWLAYQARSSQPVATQAPSDERQSRQDEAISLSNEMPQPPKYGQHATGTDFMNATGMNAVNAATEYQVDLKNVRPEIRHILQRQFTDTQEQTVALLGAAILQAYLDHPQQDAGAMLQRYDCTVIALTQADQSFIKSLTFDTSQRRQVLRQGMAEYQPLVSIEIAIDAHGQPVHPCHRVPKVTAR